jgi:transposase
MATTKVGIGIDVSKETLEVASSDKKIAGTWPNTAAGLAELVEVLLQHQVHRVVLEASGGYERQGLAALHAAGLPVVLIDAVRARHFARSLGKRAKTDAIDAEVLARMAAVAVDDSPMWKPLDDQLADLGSLLERRRHLVTLRDAERKRLRLARAIVRDDIEASIKALTKSIDDLEGRVDELVEKSATLQAKVEVLEAVPGVGRVTATSLLHLVPELGHLTRGAIAALVGVAPMNRDSGTWSGQRYIHGGRQAPRAVLYMATLAATRWNPVIRERFESLVARGKPGKVAIVACMRKLIIYLNAKTRAHLDAQEPAPAT